MVKSKIIVNHRPWFKVFINTILRSFQFYTLNKFVLASEFENNKLVRYKFIKVLHCTRKDAKSKKRLVIKTNKDGIIKNVQ